jgi:hypothetical protein
VVFFIFDRRAFVSSDGIGSQSIRIGTEIAEMYVNTEYVFHFFFFFSPVLLNLTSEKILQAHPPSQGLLVTVEAESG